MPFAMNRRTLTIALFAVYCVLFGSVRFFLEGDAWGFLHHNLWLGTIPLLIAGLVIWRKWTGWKLAVAWICWLVFLPNAPYIVTDLIHMRGKSTLPWFDLVLIFHFALAGLLVGALSLYWMNSVVEKILGRGKTVALTVLVFLLSGIAMVMGRDLRLKSEELFTGPVQVVARTFQDFDGTSITKAAVYAVMFGVFYLVFLGMGPQSEDRFSVPK